MRPDGTDFLYPGLFGGVTQSPVNDDHSLERNTGIGYLPMVGVGNAQTPRIPLTLLNNTPSRGYGGIRGIVANKDTAHFTLGSRRALQGPFIASPRNRLQAGGSSTASNSTANSGLYRVWLRRAKDSPHRAR